MATDTDPPSSFDTKSDTLSQWNGAAVTMPPWLRDIKEKAALNLKRANLLRYRFTTLRNGKLAFISAEHAVAYHNSSLQMGYTISNPCPSGTYTRTSTVLPTGYDSWCIIAPETIAVELVAVRTWITDSITDDDERQEYIDKYPDASDLLIQLIVENDAAQKASSNTTTTDLEVARVPRTPSQM